MFDLDRRSFLRVATAASFVAAGSSTPLLAAAQTGNAGGSTQSSPPRHGSHADSGSVSGQCEVRRPASPVRKEGVRTLLNYVGVAVGGSRHRRRSTMQWPL